MDTVVKPRYDTNAFFDTLLVYHVYHACHKIWL
ncbi:MAG TPA: hypothetical protein LFW20_05130 [Rickettsia endosymbiont of Omalisus fontisbellaquei]|nr:hypothetical protein [Rickettsia endosymbiont of Omalisus fontisbellaquei]